PVSRIVARTQVLRGTTGGKAGAVRCRMTRASRTGWNDCICAGGTTMSLVVRSPAFSNGQPIPRRHTGDGEDLSPPISWSGLPATAREVAMIVDDPDAPTKEPWVHWVIYGLPATDEGLAEGIPPMARPGFPAEAIQGMNSWGST